MLRQRGCGAPTCRGPPSMRVTPGGLALEARQVPRWLSLPLLARVPGTMRYMEPGDDTNWLPQLRRGVAEQCVLALLTTGERYGFELARELAARGQIIASEGTLYPLLARLRRNGLVETSWRESKAGPPRRYYHLTRRRRTSPRQLQETMAGLPRRRRRDPQRRDPRMTSRQSVGEADKLVRRYLAQLNAALQGVDASRREEILAEVHGHIEEGRAGLDPDDAAGVRTLLVQGWRPRCHRRRGGRTVPGQPPLGRVGAMADHLRPRRERAGLGRRDIDPVDLPDMESARQADRHLGVARRLGGSFLRPRGRILRGRLAARGTFPPCTRRLAAQPAGGHPPARSRHHACRRRSRRSFASADPPDADTSQAALCLRLTSPLTHQPD